MEFQQLFTTFVIVIIGAVGIFSLLGFWNQEYGTDMGSSFNYTQADINTITNKVQTLGTNAGNNSIVTSGAGTGTTSSDLVNRGLAVIGLLPTMLDIAPSLVYDGASILGIDGENIVYVNLAITLFMFTFGVLLAYMLIVGVRRII